MKNKKSLWKRAFTGSFHRFFIESSKPGREFSGALPFLLPALSAPYRPDFGSAFRKSGKPDKSRQKAGPRHAFEHRARHEDRIFAGGERDSFPFETLRSYLPLSPGCGQNFLPRPVLQKGDPPSFHSQIPQRLCGARRNISPPCGWQ